MPQASETPSVTVVGAGLSGSEAAWQLASCGVRVRLIEMRPNKLTPAHTSGECAELVCSNSLGADVLTSPGGILKAELRRLGSLILACADANRVPAGRALAVDREKFAKAVTKALSCHPLISIERREVEDIPEGPCILATGPLTSEGLAARLRELVGESFLFFYDAVAPIVEIDSVDPDLSYRASRYGVGEDYVNCPLNEEEYLRFQKALAEAKTAPLHDFEAKEERYFEGCLPIEVIAKRGVDTLRFGPLRPVGLPDPRTGKEPYAVVQLRRDNLEGTLYNLVGFQTNLLWGEQERVFRMIPALHRAEFVRFGVMHRNLFVCAPRVLDGFLRLSSGPRDLFLAGQMVGVEGYLESTAMGLAAALFMLDQLRGRPLRIWPAETAIGSLLRYLREARPETFQPMNVNLGIFPPLDVKIRRRTERAEAYARRSLEALECFLHDFPESPPFLK